ncbi:50S ribosomal protein L34 [Candidatus Peregrinibacteria bacterium]|nr:50S ribosomal protein L34 [Candidatus Peregrinibacteria bacterium]
MISKSKKGPRKKTHGYLSRMRKRAGQKVLNARRRKGRKRLTV